METEGKKELGLVELVAISLGGMIGGGIFSILGVAVEQLGNNAPLAILLGACLAGLAAFSYARLASFYKDEGATYSFFKRTYPSSGAGAAIVGWLVVFGYITTLALYSFTFASYIGSALPESAWGHALLSAGVLAAFSVLNIVSVKWTGQIEDLMVYTKMLAMIFVTGILFYSGSAANAMPTLPIPTGSVVMVAALTFVAFEGFQLAIHAYNEVRDPERNVPRAIYLSIFLAGSLYVCMAEGALWALDKEQIIADKEYALAAGAEAVLGSSGYALMVGAALLATSSAISGTLFGASRLVAVIAADGFLPAWFGRREEDHVPRRAILSMAVAAWALVMSGRLELIIEFGSLTFIVVSLLMAIANMKVREQTQTSLASCVLAILGLSGGGICIVGWQATQEPMHLVATATVGLVLGLSAYLYGSYGAHPPAENAT